MKKSLFVLLAFALILSACAPTVVTTVAPTESVVEATEPPATEEPVAEATEEVVATEAVTPTAVPPTEVPQPKTLIMGVGYEGWIARGWTIETDDSYVLNSNGVCETLTWVDFDGNVVPYLATSWQMLDDLTWEFKLRTDVTFTNGEPFNAAAVINALEYIITSPTPPKNITPTTFGSVEATADDTILIHTVSKDILMPERFTSPNTCILAPSAYPAEHGSIDPFNTGTGPFIVSDFVVDISLTLVKNPNWWGGPVALDQVTLLYVPDAAVRAGMLLSREINISVNIPIAQMPTLQADSYLTVTTYPEPRTTNLHMNMSRAPFDDLRVRQAICHAIDTQLIVDTILEGVGIAARSPFAPEEAWFNTELVGCPFDPERSIALLTEAGYAAGDINVSLWTFPTRATFPPIALAIQEMLADVGITVELRIAPYDALEPDVLAGNYDMFLTTRNHSLETYDPGGFLASDYSSAGTFNQPRFYNDEYDALLTEAIGLSDSTARYEIYKQLQSILEENVPTVFIHHNVRIGAITNNVLNFQNHPLGRYYITAVLDIAP